MNFIQHFLKRLLRGKDEPAVTEVKPELVLLGADRFWAFAIDLAERTKLFQITFDLQIPRFPQGFHSSWQKNEVPSQPLTRVTKELIFRDGERGKLVLVALGEADLESVSAELIAEARLFSLFSSKDTIDDVSPPAVTIVWDPEIVTTSEYAQLVNAIGEIVRFEGANGLKLIDSDSRGVAVEAEVLV